VATHNLFCYQHTKGELTSEFCTTLMGFMVEELDGNMF